MSAAVALVAVKRRLRSREMPRFTSSLTAAILHVVCDRFFWAEEGGWISLAADTRAVPNDPSA